MRRKRVNRDLFAAVEVDHPRSTSPAATQQRIPQHSNPSRSRNFRHGAAHTANSATTIHASLRRESRSQAIALGQKRQEGRIGVKLLASRLDVLKCSLGGQCFQVDGGRPALGDTCFDHVTDPTVGFTKISSTSSREQIYGNPFRTATAVVSRSSRIAWIRSVVHSAVARIASRMKSIQVSQPCWVVTSSRYRQYSALFRMIYRLRQRTGMSSRPLSTR